MFCYKFCVHFIPSISPKFILYCSAQSEAEGRDAEPEEEEEAEAVVEEDEPVNVTPASQQLQADPDDVDDLFSTPLQSPDKSPPPPSRKRSRPSASASTSRTGCQPKPATNMQTVVEVEHKLRLEHMKEEHRMKMEILNIKLEIAKLNLEKAKEGKLDIEFH